MMRDLNRLESHTITGMVALARCLFLLGPQLRRIQLTMMRQASVTLLDSILSLAN